MIQAAVELRRLVGKVVLGLTALWFVAVASGVGAKANGAAVEPLNLVLALVPGIAFVPAAYYSVRLHVTSDREQLDRTWPKAAVLGGIGFVSLIGIAYATYRVARA